MSFKLQASGTLAKDPEFIVRGDGGYTRFCLVGKDHVGEVRDGIADVEVTTSVWFVAFGALGESIAKNARKGDQLIVEAKILSNHWVNQEGEKQYDYSFVVHSCRFPMPPEAA